MNASPFPDYFTLLGLAPHYSLDREKLDAAYRKLLARVHPDRVALGDAAAKRRAIEAAAYVNDAYRTLKDPVARGAYLLQCSGEAPLGANEVLPDSFLVEQLEAREAADDAWRAGNGKRLAAILAQLRADECRHQTALATLFDSADIDGPDGSLSEEARRAVREHLLSLQFLARFAADLEDKLDA